MAAGETEEQNVAATPSTQEADKGSWKADNALKKRKGGIDKNSQNQHGLTMSAGDKRAD